MPLSPKVCGSRRTKKGNVGEEGCESRLEQAGTRNGEQFMQYYSIEKLPAWEAAVGAGSIEVVAAVAGVEEPLVARLGAEEDAGEADEPAVMLLEQARPADGGGGGGAGAPAAQSGGGGDTPAASTTTTTASGLPRPRPSALQAPPPAVGTARAPRAARPRAGPAVSPGPRGS
ncbi:hypothetical protein DFJ73DRAFT_578132 [Zopfochytrium polystomum]|nr:hypothetical protein DFJ73DRAFT_578132 [Zopfochytrium polystomum]